jgi:GST-like protein
MIQEEDNTMIKLYSVVSPNVVKIYIALEELGLSYEVQPVDVILGQQFDPEFLKLNPNAKVPVIVDSSLMLSLCSATSHYSGRPASRSPSS